MTSYCHPQSSFINPDNCKTTCPLSPTCEYQERLLLRFGIKAEPKQDSSPGELFSFFKGVPK